MSDVLFGGEVVLQAVILVHSCCHDDDDLHHRYYDQLFVHALCLLEVVVRRYVPLALHLAVGPYSFADFVGGFVGALEVLFF